MHLVRALRRSGHGGRRLDPLRGVPGGVFDGSHRAAGASHPAPVGGHNPPPQEGLVGGSRSMLVEENGGRFKEFFAPSW